MVYNSQSNTVASNVTVVGVNKFFMRVIIPHSETVL